jgi:uncharacterized protein Yka (UPF0111/DUF47 family)
MAKIKNDYFQLAADQVAFCVEASELLTSILENYDPAQSADYRARMHVIENNADELHHDILTRLSKEFITPIDQEDILHLVQIVDDITDGLDEVVLECYMYHLAVLPSQAVETSKIVARCVKALHEAVKELHNFKKPDKLRALLVDVNSIEGEADAAYVNSMHQLFGSNADPVALMTSQAIYESLEDICNQCEHAADVIEQIIIKNT